MKLKTLNDMREVCFIKNVKNFFISEEELKAEAIKWVKDKLKKNPSIKIIKIYEEDGTSKIKWTLEKEDMDDFYNAGFIMAKVGFFNITEEELKKC